MSVGTPPPLAAVCVLTQHPFSSLNRRVNASYALAPSTRIALRWCLFADEGSPNERMAQSTVLLERPPFVSADRKYQCVAKILAWLKYAHDTFSSASFVGWTDSDSWLLPKRLEAYLDAVALQLPPSSHASWIGLAMHWQRFDSELLDGMGFMHTADPRQEQAARKLTWDRKENLQHLNKHLAVLGADPTHYRKLSFAMTQGSFTMFSQAVRRRTALKNSRYSHASTE